MRNGNPPPAGLERRTARSVDQRLTYEATGLFFRHSETNTQNFAFKKQKRVIAQLIFLTLWHTDAQRDPIDTIVITNPEQFLPKHSLLRPKISASAIKCIKCTFSLSSC